MWVRLRTGLAAMAIFAALTLVIFQSVLLTRSSDRVVSSLMSDMTDQYLPSRGFGFDQLKHGHIPQWNPYIYGGEPYAAGYHAALFYPPNLLHLFLPLRTATNWVAALHVFLAGCTVYLWARTRGASFWAAVLAGVMYMFSGPFFLRVYSGHLVHLCVMVWPPLLMASIERLATTGRFSWSLLGIAAVTLAVLAGSPQYLYYTGLLAALYTALLLWNSPHRAVLAGGVLTAFVAGSMISAVQLLPNLHNSRETVRSGGLDYEFASSLALPPENLLTFIAPAVLGGVQADARPDAVLYFGRNYPWECSLFVGISGLTLALLATAGRFRRVHLLALMAGVTVVLALGRSLPTYRLMFDWVPMYGSFRAVTKFNLFTAMFLCPLAADGLDLLRGGGRRRFVTRAAVIVGISSAMMALVAIELQISAGSPRSDWAGLLKSFINSPETKSLYRQLIDPEFIRITALNAVEAMAVAAGVTGVTAVLLFTAGRWPRAANAMVLLATLELLTFARSTFATANVVDLFPPTWMEAVRKVPAESRVVIVGSSALAHANLDQTMLLGIHGIWGYEPGVLKRYAETLSASQNAPASAAGQDLQIYSVRNGIFQMLRARLQLSDFGDSPTAAELPGALPVAQLVPNYVVEPTRDGVLARITASDFDPRKTVVLESPPGMAIPSDATAGPAESTTLSTDAMDIRATVRRPTLLLVTNNYSAGWHASAVDANAPQKSYDIQPANRTLMAIPLIAGVHHIRVEFVAPGYRAGMIISLLSLAGYAAACAWTLRNQAKR